MQRFLLQQPKGNTEGRKPYKYPSCDSFDSEGVGEGEITLGVPGMEADERRDILKGGNEGLRIAPVIWRARGANLKSQLVEWRCLSFREARIS